MPRKLKRPYFTFFFSITVIFALALVASAIATLVSASSGPLALTALIGGSMWSGFAIGALFNWQSLTVFEDYLIFNSFGKKTKVFYRDIGEVEAVDSGVGAGADSVATLTLYVHHRSGGKTPLAMNLRLLGAKERVLLLRLIQEGGPSAHFNTRAKQVLRGK